MQACDVDDSVCAFCSSMLPALAVISACKFAEASGKHGDLLWYACNVGPRQLHTAYTGSKHCYTIALWFVHEVSVHHAGKSCMKFL